jgi:hypothetical protein
MTRKTRRASRHGQAAPCPQRPAGFALIATATQKRNGPTTCHTHDVLASHATRAHQPGVAVWLELRGVTDAHRERHQHDEHVRGGVARVDTCRGASTAATASRDTSIPSARATSAGWPSPIFFASAPPAPAPTRNAAGEIRGATTGRHHSRRYRTEQDDVRCHVGGGHAAEPEIAESIDKPRRERQYQQRLGERMPHARHSALERVLVEAGGTCGTSDPVQSSAHFPAGRRWRLA